MTYQEADMSMKILSHYCADRSIAQPKYTIEQVSDKPPLYQSTVIVDKVKSISDAFAIKDEARQQAAKRAYQVLLDCNPDDLIKVTNTLIVVDLECSGQILDDMDKLDLGYKSKIVICASLTNPLIDVIKGKAYELANDTVLIINSRSLSEGADVDVMIQAVQHSGNYLHTVIVTSDNYGQILASTLPKRSPYPSLKISSTTPYELISHLRELSKAD